jgi:hypothetical protein
MDLPLSLRMRDINDPQIAVMQRNPIRESLGLSHRSQCTYQYRVVLTEDQIEVMGSKPSASPKGLGRSPTIAGMGVVICIESVYFIDAPSQA